jgi:hypothetical protein
MPVRQRIALFSLESATTTRLRRPLSLSVVCALTAPDTTASIAFSGPTFVTTRTPLIRTGTGRTIRLISAVCEAIYFPHQDWTSESVLKRLVKFSFARNAIRSRRRLILHDEARLPCLSGKSDGRGKGVL